MKMATTYFGNSVMGQKANGIWQSLRMENGFSSKWTWAAQNSEGRFLMAGCLQALVCFN
jgi:hypothetical protein